MAATTTTTTQHAHTPTLTSEKGPWQESQPQSPLAQSLFDPFRSDIGVEPKEKRAPRKFQSSRLKGDYPKPWLEKTNKRAIWGTVILYCGALVGIAIGAIVTYFELQDAPIAEFCDSPFWEDDFSTLDPAKWTREIQVNGFGTGSFDWTTDEDSNAYVDAEGLHIMPTLTIETTDITVEELRHGYELNLTESGGDGSCTAVDDFNYNKACSIASNMTLDTIINPVRSARLTTKNSMSMRYGKIEVTAKIPVGDWLWPAIWMMPTDSVYGVWPRSGEIDIMESRGNDPKTYPEGRDAFSSALHWGPNALLDAYWRTTVVVRQPQQIEFSSAFHTYAMEWTPDYIYTYFDNKLQGVMHNQMSGRHGTMWEQGEFEGNNVNGTSVSNPWHGREADAPFDQEFYLILNVAIGGTNGFFEDGDCHIEGDTGLRYCDGDKPWRNDSPRAMLDFWNAKDTWYPTWGEGNTRGLTISSVKAYKYGGC